MLLSMLRNMVRSAGAPAAAEPPQAAPAAPAVAARPAVVPGTPQQLSPDRIYSLDSTPPVDFEPGYDLDWERATLTEIADHYKTDKGNIKHRYTQVYASYFEGLRDQPLALMEIGVACGSSLKTWSRYFPKARVTGVDIREACSTLCKAYPAIDIVIADATALQPERQYDIIIDDGSHVSQDIVQAFEHLWPSVKPGGYFVVEDLRCTHDAHYQRIFTFPKDPAAFDRGHFVRFADARLREMDNGASDIEFIHFWRQMAFVRKKAA